MMADDYRVSVELTKREIASYNFHHIRWLLYLDGIGLVILLTAVYFSIYAPNPETRSNLGILVFWGTIFLAVGLSQPFILFLQVYLLKSSAVEEQMRPKSYTFDDDGIHIEAGARRATTPWSKVLAIKEVGRLFLIYTSPRLAYVIPKRYFPSSEDRRRFIGNIIGRVKRVS